VSREAAAPGFPILGGLRADGPAPGLRDALMTFGQFVGVWALDVGPGGLLCSGMARGPGRTRSEAAPAPH
jgi:hypothetical protein